MAGDYFLPGLDAPAGNKATVPGHLWALAQPGPTFFSFILSVVGMAERV